MMELDVAMAAGRYRAAILATLASAGGDSESGTGFRIAMARCDSPIEQAYCLELFQVPGVRAIEADFDGAMIGVAVPERMILVFAQQPILHYRADFLLVGMSPVSAEPIFVIVECDGTDFHSTREQLRRDEYRQRALKNTGFKVIRFSGSEIHRNPQSVIVRTIGQFSRHGWKLSDCPRWVDDWEFRRVLSEFRQV